LRFRLVAQKYQITPAASPITRAPIGPTVPAAGVIATRPATTPEAIPSALGIASGVVAGLVAITPAAGTVGPMGALVIGLASGVICYFCATALKRRLGYDDSLDAFGVHGIGGIIRAILTGVFAAPALGGFGTVTDIGMQVWIQAKGVIFTVVYTDIVTYVILKVLDVVMGLRVNEEEESVGLDLAQHNERGYNL